MNFASPGVRLQKMLCLPTTVTWISRPYCGSMKQRVVLAGIEDAAPVLAFSPSDAADI